MPRRLLLLAFAFLMPVAGAHAAKKAVAHPRPAAAKKAAAATPMLSKLTVSQKLSGNQTVCVRFALGKAANAKVSFMPHYCNVGIGAPGAPAKVVELSGATAGPHEVEWDGTDAAGKDVLANASAVTVEVTAGAAKDSLTFVPAGRLGGESGVPPLTLVPQACGDLVAPKQPLVLGVEVANPASAERKAAVSCTVASSSGAKVGGGSASVSVPPNEVVALPVSVGAPQASGALSIAATLSGPVSAKASAAAIVAAPPAIAQSAEPVFGLIGVASPYLAQAMGAGLLLGGAGWWDSAEQWAAATKPGGVVTEADRRNVSVGGVAPPSVRDAVAALLRRVWYWQLPAASTNGYADALRSFYSTVKLAHKDAAALMQPEPAQDAALLASAGAMTDAILFKGDPNGTGVTEVATARDSGSPARELWVVLGSPDPLTADDALRGAATYLAAGVDRVLWNGPGGVLNGDGYATTAVLGCATAAQALTGAEYAGRASQQPGIHAHVFRKGGSGLIVAWSDAGSGTLDAPGVGGTAASVTSAEGTKVGGRMQGRTLKLTKQPVVVDGVGPDVLRNAIAAELKARVDRANAAAQQAGVECALTAEGATLQQIDALRLAAIQRYAAAPDVRPQVVTFIYHLERVADSLTLAAADGTHADDLVTRHALDVMNHALADLRAPMAIKEGPSGFLPHSRALLRQAEKRMYVARAAYKMRDYALATLKAQQVSALAKALVGMVAAEQVQDLSPGPSQ